jgi:UDP-glucose 4-epimerase/UDP-arabinose 4-epimerase
VFDNLSAGYREAVRWGPLVEGDVRDPAALAAAMRVHEVSAVIHFAALIEAERSVSRPDLFYDINVGGARSLLAAMREANVARLVFSSTGSFYARPTEDRPMREDDPKAPANPYAETKLVSERMIEAHCKAFGIAAVALRYFNASGADASGDLGEAHEPETHLIPIAVEAALGLRPELTVYGTDYPTADGACVRDYVHVEDLAAAHLAALDLDQAPGDFRAYNIGTGKGYSVLDVIAAIERAFNHPVAYKVGPRRPGDPASIVADPSRANAELGWRARRGIDDIVRSAIAWRRAPKYGGFPSATEKV